MSSFYVQDYAQVIMEERLNPKAVNYTFWLPQVSLEVVPVIEELTKQPH